jgi:hypothetical protein
LQLAYSVERLPACCLLLLRNIKISCLVNVRKKSTIGSGSFAIIV